MSELQSVKYLEGIKMSNVTVYFLNSHKAFAFYEDICEYAFDVTNNPSRQEEREKVYGRGRSLSVGDIVTVNENSYVCDNIGWLKV